MSRVSSPPWLWPMTTIFFSASSVPSGSSFSSFSRSEFRSDAAERRIGALVWYSAFRNRNLRRQFEAPIHAFLYVEPYEARVEVVVRPRTSEEVQAVLRLASEAGLATLTGPILALVIPFLVMIGASLVYGPETPQLEAARAPVGDAAGVTLVGHVPGDGLIVVGPAHPKTNAFVGPCVGEACCDARGHGAGGRAGPGRRGFHVGAHDEAIDIAQRAQIICEGLGVHGRGVLGDVVRLGLPAEAPAE